MAITAPSRLITEATALVGQTVHLILMTGSLTVTATTGVSDAVAIEVGVSPTIAGYTSRLSAIITGPIVWDPVNLVAPVTIPPTALSLTAGSAPINYHDYALILGGSANLGDTTGDLWLIEKLSSTRTISANNVERFGFTHYKLSTTSTTGISQ